MKVTCFDDFFRLENRPLDLASAICANASPKQRSIHNARIREIMTLNHWDDAIVREELYDFWNCRDKDSPLRNDAATLTARFNRIIKALARR